MIVLESMKRRDDGMESLGWVGVGEEDLAGQTEGRNGAREA